MSTVFADAFYWIASINPKDTWHRAVIEWTRENSNVPVVTTDEGLSEFLAFYSKRGQYLRQASTKVVRYALDDDKVLVIPQSRRSFLSGLMLFEARIDKGYSLADCISMVTMEARPITAVLTRDQHFSEEGFRLLF